jgi:predicted metal-dependent enzyme (double-stranded beta helix superfamily)
VSPAPTAFDVERFIADCRAALAERAPQTPIRELVARAVSDAVPLLRALGEPERGEIQTLHRSADLTILNVIWAPHMTLMPHNHQMWAVIGVYTGREDNIFWRHIADKPGGKIEAAGAKSLSEKDALPLGHDIIHSVTNPLRRFTGALHVYGGDFFGTARSEWDPETLLEQRFDVERTLRLFEEANAARQGGRAGTESRRPTRKRTRASCGPT